MLGVLNLEQVSAEVGAISTASAPRRSLTKARCCREVAKGLMNARHCLYLGRGPQHPY